MLFSWADMYITTNTIIIYTNYKQHSATSMPNFLPEN